MTGPSREESLTAIARSVLDDQDPIIVAVKADREAARLVAIAVWEDARQDINAVYQDSLRVINISLHAAYDDAEAIYQAGRKNSTESHHENL